MKESRREMWRRYRGSCWKALRVIFLLLFVGSLYVHTLLPSAVESLESSESAIDRQVVSIGMWMRQLISEHRRGMEGVLLVVRADQRMDAIKYHAIDWPAWFKIFLWRSAYTRRLFDHIAFTAPPGTIVHYAWGDADVFYTERVQGRDCPFSSGIRRLTEENKNLYWIHQNPAILDPAAGSIGPRTVPIPHEDAFLYCLPRASYDRIKADLRASFKSRIPGIVWRGGSTGSFPNASLSDRFRTVKAFNGAPNCSVKFSGSWWNLEPGMLSSRMRHEEMMRYRVVLDVDGNTNAWEGLRWKLAAGAAVVKISALRFTQWYYRLLQDGNHLLQISPEDPHLVDKALALATDVERAQSVATSAVDFAQEHFSCEGLEAAVDNIFRNWSFYGEPHDWRIRGSESISQEFHPRAERIWFCGGDG